MMRRVIKCFGLVVFLNVLHLFLQLILSFFFSDGLAIGIGLTVLKKLRVSSVRESVGRQLCFKFIKLANRKLNWTE